MKEFDNVVETVIGTSLRHGALSFGLENGRDAMRQFFPRVDMVRVSGRLVVTEAQPLIDYLESFAGAFAITEAQSADLKAAFEHEIAKQDGFRISTDHGFLVGAK